MPILVLAVVAWLVWTNTLPAAANDPKPKAKPGAPAVFGNAAVVQSARYLLSVTSGKVDQPYVETYFTVAAVDGWYVQNNGDGTCVVELRDTHLSAAEDRLAFAFPDGASLETLGNA